MTQRLPRLLVVTFLVAVAINFAWETGQSQLFASMGGRLSGTWWCFAASLGDGVILLAIAAAGRVPFRRIDWFVRPGPEGYAFMGALGMTAAVAIEIGARATGRWAYTDQMPLIPVIHVGLVPVLQMLVLPPLVFAVSVTWLKLRVGRD